MQLSRSYLPDNKLLERRVRCYIFLANERNAPVAIISAAVFNRDKTKKGSTGVAYKSIITGRTRVAIWDTNCFKTESDIIEQETEY